jgi:hypothetical protein
MKLQTNWQNWDLNVPLVGFEPAYIISIGVAKKDVGLDKQETMKTLRILNRTQMGKGTHTRAQYQNNKVKLDQ